MPVDKDGTVHFTTTLFALIRESLSIKMRDGNSHNSSSIRKIMLHFYLLFKLRKWMTQMRN